MERPLSLEKRHRAREGHEEVGGGSRALPPNAAALLLAAGLAIDAVYKEK
jgi:hypothetical protein